MMANVSSEKSFEIVSLVSNVKEKEKTEMEKNSSMGDKRLTVTKHTREYKFITYEKAIENLKLSSEHHFNEKYFLDRDDKYTEEFIYSVQKEIAPYVVNSGIQDIKLRGRKDRSFTAWLLLKNLSGGVKVDEFFLTEVSKRDPKVTAVTLLLSSEEERGLRISLNENQVRLYEVVNGCYEIRFNWKVAGKDCVCNITVNINSDGEVICGSQSRDLTNADLNKNRDVLIRIGDTRNEKMTLVELISLDKTRLQRFSEVV